MAGNSNTSTGRGSYTHTVRFPDGLPERLREAAKLSNRSMNGEIIARLEASFQAKTQIAPAFAELLDQHIEQEVNARLRAIAAKIGGAA